MQLQQLRTPSHLLYSHLVLFQVFSKLEIANQIISALCLGIVYSIPNDVRLFFPWPLTEASMRLTHFTPPSCFGEAIMNLQEEVEALLLLPPLVLLLLSPPPLFFLSQCLSCCWVIEF